MSQSPANNRTDQYVYRVHGWKAEIQRFPLVKWTKYFVTYLDDAWGGRQVERRARHGGEFFPTWQEAHAALKARSERRVQSAKDGLQQARSFLGMVESMQEPEHVR